MTGTPGGEVVKVRLKSHVYTSKVMPHDDATALRASIVDEVAAIGDGCGMFRFTDRHNRQIDIRGREVVVVELGVPSDDDGPHDRTRRRAGGVVGTVTVTGGPGGPPPLGVVQGGTSGTAFLRQQSAARHPSAQR